ncbi:MAG TPA: hypothetical protein VFR29_07045 [Steroidobacteraceae bacterium]|nr:hypothetical protein [Steroidobacteraceae bacterium]
MNRRMRELERRSRAAFDESVGSLDAATRSRLAKARAVALAELRQRRLRWSSSWIPAGAAAAAAVVAVMLWQGERATAPGEPALAAFEDLDLVAGAEDLDMFEEDGDFYAWAADEAAGDVG